MTTLTDIDAAHTRDEEARGVLPRDNASELRKQWNEVQAAFVDEPRKAVQRADALVADVTKKIADGFAAERSTLEGQWDRGEKVTTEALRLVLQRDRTFFDRLLNV